MRRFTTIMALLIAGCATQTSIPKSQDDGLHVVAMRRYDTLDAVSPKDIGKTPGATVCVLRLLSEWQPERFFRNYQTCLVYVQPTGQIQMTDKALEYTTKNYTAEGSVDNAVPLRIEQQSYLLKMEQEGDRIKVDDATDVPVLGVGSQIRFDKSDWVPFLGSSYRGGGFAVTSEGVVYLQHTERQNSQGKAIFTGTEWLPIEE